MCNLVVEKWIFESIFFSAFCNTPNTEQHDLHIHKQLSRWKFIIRPKHLNLPVDIELHSNWNIAIHTLRKLNEYVTLSAKINCVVRSVKLVYEILQLIIKKEISTDELLPGTIYLILRANPKFLASNVRFILDYGDAFGKLDGESGFFTTILESAVYFWEGCTLQAFKGIEREFVLCSVKNDVTKNVIWEYM